MMTVIIETMLHEWLSDDISMRKDTNGKRSQAGLSGKTGSYQ